MRAREKERVGGGGSPPSRAFVCSPPEGLVHKCKHFVSIQGIRRRNADLSSSFIYSFLMNGLSSTSHMILKKS